MGDFHGEPTRLLENQFLQLEYLANSARIVRFSLKEKDNLFAELEKEPVQTPYGKFHFRGGHRLWHAPEAMPRTYIPDNEGAMIGEIPNGVRIEMPAEAWTHIAKSIEIRINPDRPQVIVQHELRNAGAWAVEFAPWALTMLRPGGVAIFPQPVGNTDEAGLLSNRQLIVWPYTKLGDPRLHLRDDFVLVHATPSLPPIKFGYFNPHGWMAYWLDGVLFVKRFDVQTNMPHADHGCNAESYCNDEFIELETLGPLLKLEPGQFVSHTETWELYTTLVPDLIPPEIQKAIAAL
ncbi:MAG TPA: hypothetical protein VFQ13_20485 [Anaerolineales bacterium]|nr:hypothetical protein [Anaerolineales bacterium]